MAASRQDTIARAIEFIEQRLDAVLTIEEIASEVATSAFHFQRLFFAHVGESVANYIKSRRLERGALLLAENGEASIIQVALECGYQTHSAFSRAFKQHFGASPRAFADAGPAAISANMEDSRPYLRPVRLSDFDMQVDFLDLPEMWFQHRSQAGVHDGVFFPDRQMVSEGLAELQANAGRDLIAVCGGYRLGPKGFTDASAVGHFGGLFEVAPDPGWSVSIARVAAGRWAVFPHYGRYEHLHLTWNKACRSWLPGQNIAIRNEWMLETYVGAEDGFSAQIYIPV